MQKITPFLWFDHQAEAAAKFYLSVFKKSKLLKVTHYDQAAANASGRPRGSVMTVEFEIAGQKFMALNGGPHFKFNEAVSFVVNCRTQKELDYYWEKLSAGGRESQCGWLKDKFGVSWQIVPDQLGRLLSGKDKAKSSRVMQALLRMSKLDISKLERAYRGERAT
jgi:predicted 3-demethylubiquinone-9 3-methyltransferase (glyoxalase superfamily)